MAYERELEVLGAAHARREASKLSKLAAEIRLRVYRRRIDAYAACFLDSEGELTPAARLVIEHLAIEARLGLPDKGLSDAELREAAGARRIVLVVMESLRGDPAKLSRMVRQAREQQNDE